MPTFPIPAEQRVIRRYTDGKETTIRTIFIKAADGARAVVEISLVEQAISGGLVDVEGLVVVLNVPTMIGVLQADLMPLFSDLLFRATAAGELVFAETLGVPAADIAVFRREATQAARTLVGDLVTEINAGQRDAIRKLVSEGFSAGRSPAQTATMLREVVGLDSRRAVALEKYAAEMEARADLSTAQRFRMVARERAKKLKSRGLAIARTESVRAASISQDLIWAQAVEDGHLDGYEQEWVASPSAFDPKRCPTGVCKRLHGQRAPFGGEFPAPGASGPPVHTHCRCGRRTRRKAA